MSNSIEEKKKKYTLHVSNTLDHCLLFVGDARDNAQVTFRNVKCAQKLLEILLNEVNDFISRTENEQ